MKGPRLPLAAALACGALLAPAGAHASEQLATKSGCATCHAAKTKMIGPSWHDIAAKYKGQPDAVTLLTQRVRKGSKDVWGKLPMPPADPAKVSDADLKTLVSWVLKTPD